MTVVVELALRPEHFELGRILPLDGDAEIVLEALVPVGERTVPYLQLRGEQVGFESTVPDRPGVSSLTALHTRGDETLYSLEWEAADSPFFESLLATDGQVLSGRGTADEWTFQLRFASHDALSTFDQRCRDAGFGLDLQELYDSAAPDRDEAYGLTDHQRETLVRAAERGYFAVPRETALSDLAAEFGISDQAVSERLRRGTAALIASTLLRSG